jgi:hypothetical protein
MPMSTVCDEKDRHELNVKLRFIHTNLLNILLDTLLSLLL